MKEQEQLKAVTTSKTEKVSNYPYYPIAATISSQGINFLCKLNWTAHEQLLIILPFNQEDEQMMAVKVEFKGLPKRQVGLLYVLSIQCKVLKHTVELESLHFMIGFRPGFLVRLEANKNKVARVVDKYNVLVGEKQTLMMKMSSKLFSTQQYYKVWIKAPVRSIQIHPQQNQKYQFSYQIGNTIIFHKKLSEEADIFLQKQFKSINWDEMKEGTLKIDKSLAIKKAKQRSLITSTQMIIQSQSQICQYIYLNTYTLVVAHNSEGKIIFYNINDMKPMKVYSLDIEIKRINIENNFLLIMPYENSLYIIEMENNLSHRLIGHKSFITNCALTSRGNIITGGSDHRISFQNIQLIKNWEQLKNIEGEMILDTSKPGVKFQAMYSLGKYNNIRNNEYDYGFGTFLALGSMYAFLTYDFQIKIFKTNR